MNSPYGLPPECLNCHLRSNDFFCALSQESLSAFNQIKHSEVLPEGAPIFLEGRPPTGIFMVCHGHAKLSTSSRNGKTFILRIVKPGEIVGLEAVITGKAYETTAETMQPCLLNFVAREDFLRFLKQHADACLHSAQHISRDCGDAYDVVRSIGLSQSTSERIAKVLFRSGTGGLVKDGVVHARLTLTHEDIAQLTGSSRETVTRVLADLKKKVSVRRNSCLIVDVRKRPEWTALTGGMGHFSVQMVTLDQVR